jgi:SAM-dependent methyltransferase
MQDTFQLQGSAAQVYEEQKVPAMFAPLARATLDAFSIDKEDAVLDVACGTGVLARTVRDRCGSRIRIAGVDLNEGMIATARAITEEFDPPIRWKVADATKTPFNDGEFTVVICQQGIQFFSDDQAAAVEMRRVLREGGRVAITVWAGVSPFFRALADAIERHVDAGAAEQSLAPFSYNGAERLPSILAAAEFNDVKVETIAVNRVIVEPATSIPKEIMGNPVGPTVAAKGDAVMNAIVDEVRHDCSRFVRGNELVVPQEAHLVTAVAV